MALRFYLVPTIGDGTPRTNPYRAKYIAALGVRYAAMDYGREPVMLVAADVTPAQHDTIAANADVAAFPQTLSLEVGGNLSTAQAELEARNLPGSWVASTHTFLQVLKYVAVIMMIAQRYHGLGFGRIFDTGITLDTTMADLTATQRTRLRTAAESFGVDTSSATGSTTVRQALKAFADQMQGELVALAGQAL